MLNLVSGNQASVWLYKSALSWPDEKHRATGYSICPVEPVGDTKTAVGCGRCAPEMQEKRLKEASFKGETNELRTGKV